MGNLRESLLPLLAAIFLALFAGIWLWIAWELWQYNPSAEEPTRAFSDAVVTTAGFLAAAVGASTAAVLGIEIQRGMVATQGEARSLAARMGATVSKSALLVVRILVYVGVGLVNLLVWLGNSSAASDMITAFSMGILGWLAGAFSAVFRAEP